TLLLVLGQVAAAFGHSGNESYVYLDVYDTSVEGRVEYPVNDLNEVLGTQFPKNADRALVAAEENRELLHEYSEEHLAMSGQDGAEWPIVFGDLETLGAPGGAYIIVNFEVDREFTDVPRSFTVAYDGIIHAKPERDALLIIGTDWGSGTFNNEASELLRFTSDQTVRTVDLGATSFWSGFTGVILLGAEHIRIGSDHILFILALLLPSVLVFSKLAGWQPAASFGSGLWRVLKIVTMFTVAHTITLTLGGLGVVEFPPALVETIIAASIILAALHNLKPIFANKEWIIAFVFGLFHGFGFAGLLSDLGLTQSRQFVSLLGFNLGIELGQALIILMIFPALYIARRTRAYVPAMRVGSVLLIAIASVWVLDRALGVELDIDQWVFAVVLWPRSALVIAAFYVVAVALYAFDKRRDALIPVASRETPVRVGETSLADERAG
ncbi:MAG: HupE/UreJ family protein, partial [Actinomycetota bacterium]|nr:HupE/UreJ family protein [Actinomycetota bacterium]